jgi:hypothetical protein
MTTLRQLVHGRVDRADRRLLDREAKIRGIPLTKCIGDIIREYFALRQEMVSVIKSPDAPGDAHVGLVHSLVARMEGRLAVMLTTREDELRKGQRRLEAMIDWLVRLYLAHTPEVPEERRATAAAGVHRRYRNYRKAVADSVKAPDSDVTQA